MRGLYLVLKTTVRYRNNISEIRIFVSLMSFSERPFILLQRLLKKYLTSNNYFLSL